MNLNKLSQIIYRDYKKESGKKCENIFGMVLTLDNHEPVLRVHIIIIDLSVSCLMVVCYNRDNLSFCYLSVNQNM